MTVRTEDNIEKIQLCGLDRRVIQALPCDKLAAILINIIAQIGVNGNILPTAPDHKALLPQIPEPRLPIGQLGARHLFLFHGVISSLKNIFSCIDNYIKL